MTATWLGPCKAGQRGGDVILPNGAKENVLDMTRSTLDLSKTKCHAKGSQVYC